MCFSYILANNFAYSIDVKIQQKLKSHKEDKVLFTFQWL